jgi:hypothetical protein
MKVQSSNFKFQIHEALAKASLVILFLFAIHFSLFTIVFASEKWQGVDESVVERVAKEHGREARKPFINTDQGDLLLFAFLVAGSVGGFTAGYYWRMLTEQKKKKSEDGIEAKHGNIL